MGGDDGDVAIQRIENFLVLRHLFTPKSTVKPA